MNISLKVQKFLKQKLIEQDISMKTLAKESSIAYSKIYDLVNARYITPELKTLLDIANYFQCSLDEVVGSKSNFINTTKNPKEFYNISIQDITINLRNFIFKKIKEYNITPYILSKNTNLSHNAIRYFLKEDGTNKMLGSSIIVSLADYFEVSIDEMIGRIPSTPCRNTNTSNKSINVSPNVTTTTKTNHTA